MKSALLDVVSCVSNPIRWVSRIELYKQFEQHMIDSGVRLTIIECAYGDRPFEIELNPLVNHVRVRSKTLIWNKENLLNLAIQHLPSDWQYVAWLDSDIFFRDKNWASNTLHALQHYDIIQTWKNCYDLGPKGEHIHTHDSLASLYHEGAPLHPKFTQGYKFGHPGYAWAATRGFINAVGGLMETAALGAGDHHMSYAMMGRVDDTLWTGLHPGYIEPLKAWEARAKRYSNGNMSYIPGTIEHGWHGPKNKRGYIERRDVLVNHQFNPVTDMLKNSYGVLELAGNKPRLRHAMDRYFRQRAEDSNVIG